MKKDLIKFLKELRAYGVKNNIPNVTEEVGRFLNMLIRIKNSKMILEIGCANGYSTLWMAEAAKAVGARVHTIDFSRPSLAQAKDNVAIAGFFSAMAVVEAGEPKILENKEGARTTPSVV
ncbi:MAG: methyltransferase domain-containing protein, partial [Patescibacteria group bacterium]